MRHSTLPVLIALVLAISPGCGSDKTDRSPVAVAAGTLAKATIGRVLSKRGGAPAAPQYTRADIEKYGIPLLRAVIKTRSADALLTIGDTKGPVVTWATTDGTTFTLRENILIETRGLGADLMSSSSPSGAEIAAANGTHNRSYFFLGSDDQTERRDYACEMSDVGPETIVIYERSHETRHVDETCIRAEGKITNSYWLEDGAIRKSKQWTSPLVGYIEFERAVD